MTDIKLIEKVTVLPVVTTLSVPVERVLSAALKDDIRKVWVIGEDASGMLYFASSESDGGEALWWMEKAKRALMEATEP